MHPFTSSQIPPKGDNVKRVAETDHPLQHPTCVGRFVQRDGKGGCAENEEGSDESFDDIESAEVDEVVVGFGEPSELCGRVSIRKGKEGRGNVLRCK